MSWEKRFKLAAACAFVALAVPALVALREQPSSIEAVRQQGELVVAIRQGLSSHYQGPFGPAGFEYELAQAFADDLGVRLRLVEVETADAGLRLLAERRVHLAVGQATREDDPDFAYSVPVQRTSQFVVCDGRRGPMPANVGALAERSLAIAAGNHHGPQLARLQQLAPGLHWTGIEGASEENLLGLVHAGRVGCAVIDSPEWALHRHLFPDLRVALELPQPTFLAWAFQATGDSALREFTNAWLARRDADGTLAALRAHYYDHLESLTQLDARRFHQAIRGRLPQYSAAFRREAERNGLDWRLVAAVAYQESHWHPDATSPTGVQGLMQLTLDTALSLGIDDRTDPLESIRGGARYLRQMINQLPAEIPEPDRTWMALAAYNAGLAHVLDARELARKRGLDPNSWADVRDTLPLLKQQEWYSQTRYGYARGATQAIIYVRHVRRYYDLLVLASNSSERNDLALALNTGSAGKRL